MHSCSCAIYESEAPALLLFQVHLWRQSPLPRSPDQGLRKREILTGQCLYRLASKRTIMDYLSSFQGPGMAKISMCATMYHVCSCAHVSAIQTSTSGHFLALFLACGATKLMDPAIALEIVSHTPKIVMLWDPIIFWCGSSTSSGALSKHPQPLPTSHLLRNRRLSSLKKTKDSKDTVPSHKAWPNSMEFHQVGPRQCTGRTLLISKEKDAKAQESLKIKLMSSVKACSTLY